MAKMGDMVGFEDQAVLIKEQLIGYPKQLEVVSIVGMGGLGKTTLAKQVYDDQYIFYHFHVRAWITISQAYQIRDLLIGICSQIKPTSSWDKMNDGELRDQLHKSLKGKKYLIVMDDIWSVQAWNDIRRCLPNDNNGSRVLFTSRLEKVCGDAKPNSTPHKLRFLSEDESLKLLHEKVFPNGSWPSELTDVGKRIVHKCRGLPLSVVLMGGLLAKTEKTLDQWEQVSQSISSYMIHDTEQGIDARASLALSYNQLPDHLKPCFLCFGVFPEDYEIPVRKLVWLWIAEGFIQRSAQRRLEDVANEYLRDLLERSLILISKRRSGGGIKSCRIHDLLHDFCREKAKEENFMEHIYEYKRASSSSSPIEQQGCHRRLCIYSPLLDYILQSPSLSDVYSFLSFLPDSRIIITFEQARFIFEALSIVRVLDLTSIRLQIFPAEIAKLFDLRYLALRVEFDHDKEFIPNEVSTLKNLETLIVLSGSDKISLPFPIWNMTKLRHLHVTRSTVCTRGSSFQISNLAELQTVSTLLLKDSGWDLLRSAPNLKKLGCSVVMIGDAFKFLEKLEEIKIHYIVGGWSLPNLPFSVKKVKFDGATFPWSEISKLGSLLPNLEVLSLRNFILDRFWYSTNEDLSLKLRLWDLSNEDKFLKLKVLKIDARDLVQWNATSDNFPVLERLLLRDCWRLKEIPQSIGDIPTLQMLELENCKNSAGRSAKQIVEDQQSIGNDQLKIQIYSSWA